jgi:predicted ATPase/DNA-binding CsgD family transcriptional regulator
VDSHALTDAGVSDREAEVLALLGEHLTNAEISARLFISVRTVESHVSALLRKLEVADRRALATLAPSLLRPADGDGGNGGPVTVPAPLDLGQPVLPAPLTSFVGRSAERAALADALAHHRLVTAVGPGGVGKTRLALAVAADVTGRHAQGAWYVDLVPVTDPAMIGAAVAGVLGFAEQLGRTPTETVVGRLAEVEALLVLDNCEHLLDGVAELVERMLTACPRVTVLATSQARLSLPFEWAFAVPGLGPGGGTDDGDDEGDAVALFLERAAMVGWAPQSADDRSRVAAICAALDGSALAIELAAARLATRGLDGLEAALANPLGLLTGGRRVDERHRSLRSALDWSYDLLGPVDRAVLRQTAVFAAPFTAEAAAAVLVGPAPDQVADVAEALARLADHSLLIVVTTAEGTRSRLLEAIRQYGTEQLDAVGERDEVYGRHLRWCQASAAALVARAQAGGSAPDPGSGSGSGSGSGARCDASADELRAALQWGAGRPEWRADAHHLALRLAELASALGLPSESQHRYEQAAGLAADVAARARLLHVAADVALSRLAGDEALRLLQAAADAAEQAGDLRGAAIDLTRMAELMDRSPGLLSAPRQEGDVERLVDAARRLAGDDPHVEAAILTVDAGAGVHCRPLEDRPDGAVADADAAERDAERAAVLARQVGDLRLESAALDQLTVQQLMWGRIRAASVTSARRLDLLTGSPSGPGLDFELSDALHMASLTSIGAGDLAAARRYAQQRHELPFHQEEDHFVVNWLLVGAALAGDLDEAAAQADRFRASWEGAGRPMLSAFAVAPAAAAMVHGLRGDDAARRTWLDLFDTMRHQGTHPSDDPTVYGPLFMAMVALHRGDAGGATAVLVDEPESIDMWHTVNWRQWYTAVWAEAAVLAGRADAGARLERARPLTVDNPVATGIVERAAALAAGELGRLPAIAAAFAPDCPYQQARTLVLAGGAPADEGRSLLAALHATLPPVPSAEARTP